MWEFFSRWWDSLPSLTEYACIGKGGGRSGTGVSSGAMKMGERRQEAREAQAPAHELELIIIFFPPTPSLNIQGRCCRGNYSHEAFDMILRLKEASAIKKGVPVYLRLEWGRFWMETSSECRGESSEPMCLSLAALSAPCPHTTNRSVRSTQHTAYLVSGLWAGPL
eukprot:GHVU01173813.1.p1 GENE.GHVU01173813.1~~GHVU01173813.1.p1  ORF type:complete len:166 (+),score=2.17 GHVU01173813.1:1094-1591(+)